MTIKSNWEAELKELDQKKKTLEREDERYRERLVGADHFIRQAINRQRNAVWRKIERVEEKISDVTNAGISTKDKRKLMKELRNFKSLDRERSLGSRDIVAVGYSDLFKSHIRVEYTRWTSFMRNVRGCASYAGTTDIKDIKRITKATYTKLLKKAGYETTYFMGAKEKKRIR